VPWDQIVKGYEYEKDKLVLLKDEDFKRVDLKATPTIDIVDFVELAEINPMFSTSRISSSRSRAEAARITSCAGFPPKRRRPASPRS